MLFLYVEIAVRMCVRLFVLHVCMQNTLSARLCGTELDYVQVGHLLPLSLVNDISDVPLKVISFPAAPVTFLTCVSSTLGQRGEVEFEKAAQPDRYDSKHFFRIFLACTHL